MKKSAFHRIIMFGLFLTLACAAVSAQSTANTLSVRIPFDFVVGEQTLPAGQYTIEPLRDKPSVLVIQSADRQARAVILTTPMDARQAPTKTRLIFSDYGQQHFLAEVWAQGDKAGRQLVKSRVERELTKSVSAKTNTISLHDDRQQK